MKNCILTPTFSGHFQFIKKYLKSFNRFVSDKENCIIYFIINKSENNELSKIISDFSNLDIKILFFEDILKKFNIEISPEELLQKYGKYSFQSLKKFYGMLYLDKYQHFLVMDTETMWVNPTNMSFLFSNFFSNPYIFYSNVNKRPSNSINNIRASENINYVLKSHCNKWFVEQFVRLWDVNILKDLFANYGSCLEIVDKIYNKELNSSLKMGLFESVLYDQYIYENKQKYGYNCIDLDKKLEENLPKSILEIYKKKYFDTFKGNCGITEFFILFLNRKNYQGFLNIFKNIPLKILRVDDPNGLNCAMEQKFINDLKPNILTCSQDHCFGLNKNNYILRFGLIKPFKKLKKHFSIFMSPLIYIIKWCTSIILTVKYSIKCLLKIFKYFIQRL